MKTTRQTLYERGWFDNYANADKVLDIFLFGTKHGGNFEKVYDNVQQLC